LVLSLGKSYLVPGLKSKIRLDYLGAVLATVSLILIVYAIVSFDSANIAHSLAWGVVAIVLFIAFIVLQAKKAHPLLPLSIFKTPNLSVGNLVIGLLAAAWIPLWFFLNLYLQQTLQYSAFNSGLALLPMTITIMIILLQV
jgi:hypothetical protein